jgi:hypothetical protein
VWSTKSSANHSSNIAKSAWPWTCSVLSLTTALTASASVWGGVVVAAGFSGLVIAWLSVELGDNQEWSVWIAHAAAAAWPLGRAQGRRAAHYHCSSGGHRRLHIIYRRPVASPSA